MASSQTSTQTVRHDKHVPIADLLATHQQDILRLAATHGAHNVRAFGSVARGEATASSDLDLLIELNADRSLLDRIGLIQDLEDLLGVRVQVVTEKGLHPKMRDAVLDDACPLW